MKTTIPSLALTTIALLLTACGDNPPGQEQAVQPPGAASPSLGFAQIKVILVNN